MKNVRGPKRRKKRLRKPSGRVICWVGIAGTYIGKQYKRGEIADFGHFIQVEKLEQLKRTGHLKAVEDVALIEICPRCETRFINRKVTDRKE
jgi:hypothetical protein